MNKLDHAKALVSHAIKEQSLEEVIFRALTLLVEAEEKRRFGAPRKKGQPETETLNDGAEDTTCFQASAEQDPSSKPASAVLEGSDSKAHSRYIPAAVRREVFERDGHRCTYRSPEGTRCTETRYLEFDHVITPWAQGGAPTAENLTLRCGMHNRWAARQLFGNKFVESKIHAKEQVAVDDPSSVCEHPPTLKLTKGGDL
jgi:hypothetical protein